MEFYCEYIIDGKCCIDEKECQQVYSHACLLREVFNKKLKINNCLEQKIV
ncbi:MAG TPA: hypothetical protein VJ438_03110 [Candidatus Nanoarchaeia archaeon]|nr:hypothetical protein [Candidatus Nanoarchaeia archaeon]